MQKKTKKQRWNVKKNRTCRFCKAKLSTTFINLGKSPLANSFLSYDDLSQKEIFYPLHAFVCDECFLVQLNEIINPEFIFTNYLYFSSYSDIWLKHAEQYVKKMVSKFDIDKNSQVVEIGSNDGYLLQYFIKKNISVVGIEPAKNIAKIAIKKGIPTKIKFFSKKTAKTLLRSGVSTDLLIGNNVLAQVPNLHDFIEGMKILLKSTGIITLEFPHLLQLIKHNQFDTIYHEHYSYFSLLTLEKVFSSHGLTIFDVEEIPMQGGSLRIFAKHSENDNHPINEKVYALLEKEKQFELNDISTYMNFSRKIKALENSIRDFFITAKKSNKKIVCYGAAAKGNTLLNYCGIGTDLVDYVVDKNPHKQGLFLPGTHIHINSPEKIQETKPDYLVILPWNLKNEIIQQSSYIRDWGGKFVIIIPKVKTYQ